ncbi:MAG: glycosyltransferase [Pseudobdellovibrionaceae bacterium]
MIPRPQLSLCIPQISSGSEKGLIQEFHENLSHFFQKIPLAYEVLFAVSPDQDESRPLLHSLAEKNPAYRIIENKKPLSRAQSIQALFGESRGEILVPTDLGLAIPLSELLKILEAFFSDNELELVFGNRFKAKKNLESQKFAQNKIENFFMGVLQEKTPWKFADPFCPTLGWRRSSFERFSKELKNSGWHWTPEVQRIAQLKELKTQEIALYMGSQGWQNPPRSEVFHLLNFILFRV